MRYFNPDLGRLIRLKTWQAHYRSWDVRTRHRVQHQCRTAWNARWFTRLDYAQRLGVVRRRLVRIKLAAHDGR